MPKISVIVPVYKVEKYLHRCVDSILNQSFSDFELILVDDGSPDNCPQICDEYAKKDNRIIVIHKKNGGLSDARNKGIDYSFENSNSEWLTFIDSDDWIHKDYLKYLYEACIENNVDISVCDFLRTENESTKDTEINKYDYVFYDNNTFYKKKYVNFVIAWGKLYKKYLFENIRYPYGKLHEDLYITYKLIYKCNKTLFIQKPLYYYFDNPNSIMSNITIDNYLYYIEGYSKQVLFFQENNNIEMTVHVSRVLSLILLKIGKIKNKNQILKIKESIKVIKFSLLFKKNNNLYNILSNLRFLILIYPKILQLLLYYKKS